MKSLLKLTLVTLLACTSVVNAEDFEHGDLVLQDPYTRTTPPAAPVAGGFLTITNKGEESDTLIGGKVEFAEVVEVHEMPMVDGVMKMRQLEGGLEIPAGESVVLKPGSFHVMFIKLKQQMVEGDSHDVTLEFAKAGEVTVPFAVRDITAMMEDMKGKMGHGMKMEHGEHGDKVKHGMKHEMKKEADKPAE